MLQITSKPKLYRQLTKLQQTDWMKTVRTSKLNTKNKCNRTHLFEQGYDRFPVRRDVNVQTSVGENNIIYQEGRDTGNSFEKLSE